MEEIRIGYCRNLMNPSEPIPLAGYGNDRLRYHTRITEDICATCVAVADAEGSTVLLMGVDLAVAPTDDCAIMRQRVSEATGIPQERVLIAGTHTHAGPTLGMKEDPAVQRYYDHIFERVTDAAQQALADLRPASIFTGSIEVPFMNFIKHYKVRDIETGEVSYIGDQFGTAAGKMMIDHATQVDPTLHVVKFVREGAKDVVIANWRAHPHFRGGYEAYDLSSDYIHPFRINLENALDCHALFLQGAGGNINSSSRMQAERRHTTALSYGMGLAAYAVEALQRCMQPAKGGKVGFKQVEFFGDINHTNNHLLEQAQKIEKYWDETFDREGCVKMGEPYGIRSPYHAEAICMNAERTKEKNGKMILNAVTIGQDLSLVTFPGELFDAISAHLEVVSPYRMTMLMGYCYHHVGYLPSMAAFKYTSYETDITRFAPGTGEAVGETYLNMLNELAGK